MATIKLFKVEEYRDDIGALVRVRIYGEWDHPVWGTQNIRSTLVGTRLVAYDTAPNPIAKLNMLKGFLQGHRLQHNERLDALPPPLSLTTINYNIGI